MQASQCFVTPIEKWWALRLCHQFDLLLFIVNYTMSSN